MAKYRIKQEGDWFYPEFRSMFVWARWNWKFDKKGKMYLYPGGPEVWFYTRKEAYDFLDEQLAKEGQSKKITIYAYP